MQGTRLSYCNMTIPTDAYWAEKSNEQSWNGTVSNVPVWESDS